MAGEIPSTVIYQDERTMAFRDLAPQAPVHVLVVPRDHHASVAALCGSVDGDLLAGALVRAAAQVAAIEGLEGPESGWRMVVNTGPMSGQTVEHVHLHVLGGRRMAWPPG